MAQRCCGAWCLGRLPMVVCCTCLWSACEAHSTVQGLLSLHGGAQRVHTSRCHWGCGRAQTPLCGITLQSTTRGGGAIADIVGSLVDLVRDQHDLHVASVVGDAPAIFQLKKASDCAINFVSGVRFWAGPERAVNLRYT